MICSGRLTETLQFYEVIETQTKSGYKTSEERFMFQVKAEKTKNKENYVVNAEELFHTTQLRFRLRYRKEIDETNVVVYKENRYRITSLDEYKRSNEIIIYLEKINE